MSEKIPNVIRYCPMVALVFALSLGFATTRAQQPDQVLPVVISASVPFYPRTANIAHVLGEVRIRVSTDGTRVSKFADETGPPMLVQETKDNIRSWVFANHKPISFIVTFKYRIEDEASCAVENSSVILHMPSEVQVSAKRVVICDEAKPIKHKQR
jgi:hypothetical protein